MKLKRGLIINIIIFLMAINLYSSDVAEVVTIIFDESDLINRNRINTINCKLGYGTGIELSKGKYIKHFTVGDPKLWFAESDGKNFAIIRPLAREIQTSLFIVTTEDDIYTFNLIEISDKDDLEITGKVYVNLIKNEIFKKKKSSVFEIPGSKSSESKDGARNTGSKKNVNSNELNERVIKAKIAESRVSYLKKLNTKYKVKDKYFKIKSVCDDGIFTYINMEESQKKPAVFINKYGNKLEPVRSVERDGLYIVHRVLENHEQFVLRVGENISTIKAK